MNYTIKRSGIFPFLESVKKKFQVFVPALNASGASCFQPFEGQELFLEKRTDFSAKEIFRPAKEEIFSFRKTGAEYEIKPVFNQTKRVLFGIRPCDTHALQALDKLFVIYFGDDQFYSIRRANTILIALQCSEACENGFCTSMGTSMPAGHDLLFIERGPDFFVKAETEKGKGLISREFFKPTSDAPPETRIACRKQLETRDLGKNLYENFEHKAWEEESKSCLSCSSCTQICPTCYCYITDDEFAFGSESKSSRFRLLDSCQLQRFTKVAGNHVFRESRKARLRQFVLHKFSYYEENHGVQLCVGCGRCITACPSKIDLTFIANRIQKDALGAKK